MRLTFDVSPNNDPMPNPFGRDAEAGFAVSLTHTVCLERMIERLLDRAVGVAP